MLGWQEIAIPRVPPQCAATAAGAAATTATVSAPGSRGQLLPMQRPSFGPAGRGGGRGALVTSAREGLAEVRAPREGGGRRGTPMGGGGARCSPNRETR
eukprot:15430865-Alexandrium_andersonii.AAC.1